MNKVFISKKYRKIQFYFNYLKIKLLSYPGIVVIGCGRSGTTYLTKKFQKLGYKVGHERLLKNGICSWLLASDQTKVPFGPNYKQVKSLNFPILHQVRNPIDTISSCLALGRSSYKFVSKEIPINYKKDTKLLMAMKYWYYWNLKAERKSEYSYRIENIDNVFNIILRYGKFPIINIKKNIRKNINTRYHKTITLEDIKKEDKELTMKIIELGYRYGYVNL